MAVVDADAHVNEEPLAWAELAEAHPGWLQAGRSGERPSAGLSAPRDVYTSP